MAGLVSSSKVASRLGLTIRGVTKMAAAGKVPGATKLGGVWRFDPDKIEYWIRAGQPRPWRPSTKEARRTMDVSSIRAATSGNRLRHLLDQSPKKD